MLHHASHPLASTEESPHFYIQTFILFHPPMCLSVRSSVPVCMFPFINYVSLCLFLCLYVCLSLSVSLCFSLSLCVFSLSSYLPPSLIFRLPLFFHTSLHSSLAPYLHPSISSALSLSIPPPLSKSLYSLLPLYPPLSHSAPLSVLIGRRAKLHAKI